jgi:hypothetical protein
MMPPNNLVHFYPKKSHHNCMLPFIILTNLRLLIACNTFPSCTIRGESVEARKEKKVLCLLLLSIPADFLCAAVDYNPHKLYNLTNELKFFYSEFILC